MPKSSLYRVIPQLGFAFQEESPERICQYSECPRRKSGYAGRKMKVCGRCKHVRYCDKECQKADWVRHQRSGCKEYQTYNDYDGWMERYKPIFAWAATEALRVHTTDDILHKVLIISATYADTIRASLGPIPSPFYIVYAEVVPFSDRRVPMRILPEEIEESRAIRARGGGGRAKLIFQFLSWSLDGIGMPYDIDLTDPLIPGYKESIDWKSLLAGIVNGTISVADISRRVQYQPTGVENVHDVEEGKSDDENSLVDGLEDVRIS